MTTYMMPICFVCKNNTSKFPWKCKAFPKGIPEKIIKGESDHRREYQGDDGIRFEPTTSEAETYAKELFDA